MAGEPGEKQEHRQGGQDVPEDETGMGGDFLNPGGGRGFVIDPDHGNDCDKGQAGKESPEFIAPFHQFGDGGDDGSAEKKLQQSETGKAHRGKVDDRSICCNPGE